MVKTPNPDRVIAVMREILAGSIAGRYVSNAGEG